MRPRPARRPSRPPVPGRPRSARRPGLLLLALALLTTLVGLLAAQTALESRLPVDATVLAAADGRLAAAFPTSPAPSWGARPASPTDSGTAWRHAAKVKRTAARVGHRGSRGLTILLLAAVVALFGAITANSARNRTGDQLSGTARTAVGHPRRAPPAFAA